MLRNFGSYWPELNEKIVIMMIDLEKLKGPIDISIPLNFNGQQPNAYGVERATAKACEAGDMVGDTRRGGSVNVIRHLKRQQDSRSSNPKIARRGG